MADRGYVLHPPLNRSLKLNASRQPPHYPRSPKIIIALTECTPPTRHVCLKRLHDEHAPGTLIQSRRKAMITYRSLQLVLGYVSHTFHMRRKPEMELEVGDGKTVCSLTFSFRFSKLMRHASRRNIRNLQAPSSCIVQPSHRPFLPTFVAVKCCAHSAQRRVADPHYHVSDPKP